MSHLCRGHSNLLLLSDNPIANRRPVRGPFATNLIPPSRRQLDDVFPRIALARNICSCSYGGADCLSWICITGHRSSPLDALAIAWLFPPFNLGLVSFIWVPLLPRQVAETESNPKAPFRLPQARRRRRRLETNDHIRRRSSGWSNVRGDAARPLEAGRGRRPLCG